ncbi:alpha/beta hydrolase [Prodigiosinella confusarubida]|uniref:Alpha/beta hydrolase n=1 Tax=Serratia sp. (strain ATCC 39006) TaxID=104623 RepID=A0A2I5TMV7_SERS3|nr:MULTISPECIES: esterase [Enterobacterales]AUH01570.1 alpha/beta hydrolase [Serratia sp. ATCC 39006]AUH05893.1 alpha/beta hydrolase [Serratia sp. ATCC 39006]
MKLNYRWQNAHQPQNNLPIVFIHGLFGNLDNLGVLARDLQNQHDILQIDVRNHGLSPRSPEMNYTVMAEDVLALLDDLQLKQVIMIGHSMGGKIAMALSALMPDRIDRIVVIDIAPVDYQLRRHDQVFSAVKAVSAAGITQRAAAAVLMRDYLPEEGVIQFLLKSFQQGEWRFNVPALWDQYENIVGWQELPAWHGPILFIRGGNSPYLDDRYRDALLRQFPAAKAHVVAGAGHWVHAEKTEAVLRAIHRFLDTH